MLAQFKLCKLKLWGIVQFQVHTYVAILCMPTELRLIRAYLGYGYGRPRQQLRAYYCYGYGCTTATGTGVLRLWLRAYYDYGYGRTTATGTGVLRLRLQANVRAYYVNFFTAYTVYLHKTVVSVRSIWHPMHGHSCQRIHSERVHIWTHCTHSECSTPMQVESCESKLHGCLSVTRSFDTIGVEMFRHIVSAPGAGEVTSQCTNAYMCT